jgi:hypothetical protein
MLDRITLPQLEDSWKFKASSDFSKNFSRLNLEYENLSIEQSNNAINQILNTLDQNLERAGENRIGSWEKGWEENLNDFILDGNQLNLIPKYFGKFKILRWNSKFIKPSSNSMEYDLLSLLIELITETYLLDSEYIYEFGCGTGHNLLRIRDLCKDAFLYGLDWSTSSQRIIHSLSQERNDTRLQGLNFDYFKPNFELLMPQKSSVLTVASLEQTGTNFKLFIDYLLQSRPEVIVHIEPIAELLDPSNLLDNLSIKYFKKRNYLNGLLTYLRELEKQNRIEIVTAQRSFIGSLFIEGYSLVVWKIKSE